jgi:hypothetical protein
MVAGIYWTGFALTFIALAPRICPDEDLPFRVLATGFISLAWPVIAGCWLLRMTTRTMAAKT